MKAQGIVTAEDMKGAHLLSTLALFLSLFNALTGGLSQDGCLELLCFLQSLHLSLNRKSPRISSDEVSMLCAFFMTACITRQNLLAIPSTGVSLTCLLLAACQAGMTDQPSQCHHASKCCTFMSAIASMPGQHYLTCLTAARVVGDMGLVGDSRGCWSRGDPAGLV